MSMRRQILSLAALLFFSAVQSRAGGPAFVAGSGYNPGVEGQPLIWAGGIVEYYTDQGDLSPIMTGAQGDALIAAALNTWTSVPGVSLTVSQGGHLAEDVNGSNIVVTNGTITAPADITPSAIATPLGVVYDYDGTVTDALLGEGAGTAADCFTNAVYGGPDNFSASGNIAHALVVINGVCASTTEQLPDVQYRLVRVLGRILGLGWSQVNVNVLTRNPLPTPADFTGFPVMHFADPISCVPITICYSNPGVPALDDIDALARLYPAPSNSQPQGRIYGSVYFTDASGVALQQMQGVNVVARLMQSNEPSRQYVVTSVSGFLFCGNAGNIIDGYLDANGLPYARWGSNDTSLEGFFDLGQLPIPPGQTTAQYQLSVEPLDPDWSLGVEPYVPTQVTPSGAFAPVVVTVTNGSNVERDILMLQDEIAQLHPGSGSTYAQPSPLPQGGAWGSWISGYDSVDFFAFNAQANRTASVAVTALDENGQPTENKLQPVIGVWELSDQTGNAAPASTPSAFNSTTFALTRLDVQFGTTEAFRVGVADFRGDGRPDYFYQASLLYSDTVTPPRISLAGGTTTLNGIGFNQRLRVSVGSSNGITLTSSAAQIQVALPAALQDGPATIQVTDPVTGSFSQMIGALTYGASSTDLLLPLQVLEPSTPVGSTAANPIRVRAVAADGVTPVNGATIAWSSTNNLQLSVCVGAASCSVLSDEAGESSTLATPTVTGPATINVALAPASYSPPQSQQATVLGTSTSLDLVALSPTSWIAQNATIAVPLTVEALALGVAKPNVSLTFTITKGAAVLSASTATTNAAGLATVTAQLTNQTADVQVSACITPNGPPCVTFTLFSTPAAIWQFETVSGSLQVVPIGQSFAPLVMRVTDGSPAANPVMGVSVSFKTTLARVSSDPQGGIPVILGSSQVQLVTAQNGLASMIPVAGGVGPCEVVIVVSAGELSIQFQMESVGAIIQPSPPTSEGKIAETTSPSQVEPTSGSQPSSTESTPSALFAVPLAIQSEAPALNLPSNDCEPSLYNSSGDPVNSVQSTTSAINNSFVTTCIRSNREEAEIPHEVVQVESDVVATKVTTNSSSTAEVQPNPASSSGIPIVAGEDKRSCRELASDGPLFP